MNNLEIIRRQELKKQALQKAQYLMATLCQKALAG